MPRVHTATARKDYPKFGIIKGDKYYYWTPYRQGRKMSKTRPTPSQVESNATRSGFLAIIESCEAEIDAAGVVKDVKDALCNAADDFDGVVEELRAKSSNIEEGFGHETELSTQFNDQADELESWADELRGADFDEVEEPGEEPEEPDRDEYEDDLDYGKAVEEYDCSLEEWEGMKQAYEEALEAAKEEATDLLSSAPDI